MSGIPKELLEKVVNAKVGHELSEALREVKEYIIHRDGPMVNAVFLKLSTTKDLTECLDRVQAALDAGVLTGAEGIVALDYRDKLRAELERRKEKADWERLTEQKRAASGPGGVPVDNWRVDDKYT